MKKIIILLMFFLLSTQFVEARWYGNHGVSYNGSTNYYGNTGGEIDLCDEDSDPTGVNAPGRDARVALNNGSSAANVTPHGTTVFNVSRNGTMRCLYWDPVNPVASSISYTNAWSNATSHTVNFSGTDTGGSGLRRYQIQFRRATDTPTFTAFPAWGSANITTYNISGRPNSFSSNQSFTVLDNSAYQFRIRFQDEAMFRNNPTGAWGAWLTGTDIIRVDQTPPTLADISPNTPDELLAQTSQAFSINVDNALGSPIVSIRGNFDAGGNVTRTSSPWFTNGNTSNVDSARISAPNPREGSRERFVNITRIEDEAGNITTIPVGSTCWSAGVPTAHLCFYVFANTSPGTMTAVANTTNLASGTNIADGSPINTTVNVNDQFGNDVVYAPSISRTLDFNLTMNNSLRRNQYNNSGTDSALAFGVPTNIVPILASANASYNNRQSTSSNYDIPFYAFAPTRIGDALVPGQASVTSINYDVNGTLGASTTQAVSGSNVNLLAAPLFTSSYAGEIVTQGFIEGATQNSSISISKVNATSTSSESLRMEFGEVNTSGANIANSRYRISVNGNALSEGNQPLTTSVPTEIYSSLPLGTQNFSSFMIQDAVVPSFTGSYLASIIQYQHNGLGSTITYPYDIVGQAAYGSGTATNNSTQVGVRILGNTSSQSTEEILSNQFSTDVRILGRLTKSTFRRDIEKSVNQVITNIPAKTGGSQVVSTLALGSNLWDDASFNTSGGSRGESIFGEEVLYFGDMSGATVTLNTQTNIEGTKTLVVENGNVYISANILNSDNDDSILGIIALNGNIYIDPSVTDIHASLYTNRAIISYDGTIELDGSTEASVLANQLYIKGSIFSENTIGGSRGTLRCPYYVNLNCTSLLNNTHRDNAQKYDLNFIRRYFIFDTNGNGSIEPTVDSPANSGNRSIGGGIGSGNEEFPFIVDYNPQIQITPPPFFN